MMVERQLQGELLKILQELLKKRKLEETLTVVQEQNYSDIQIRKGSKVILSLELKDPRNPEGKTVFHPKVYQRELRRAKQIGAELFAISNFREVALFHLTNREKDGYIPLWDKDEKSLYLLLESFSKNFKPRKELKELLKKLADAVLDYALNHLEDKVQIKPPDERFIFKIKSLVSSYAYGLADKIEELYRENNDFRQKVDNWFIQQQWSIPTDYEDFLKFSHLALLMLVAKLVFYKAVYDSRIYEKLPKLIVPDHIKSGKELKKYLFREYFIPLIEVTGNYENLIGEEEELLNTVPFKDDSVTDLVKSLVWAEEEYDFSKLGYDVVGRIFEELIKEEERHKLGQYFTPAKVIDLINAFCIRTGNEKVLDPTCGAGTFLVRVYERKKKLTGKNHAQLLEKIYGIDISPYAVELATLNLVIRDLRYPTVHPKVFLKDFFDVKPKGEFSEFEAIVGNPPYTRQEEIDDLFPQEKQKIEKTLKEDYGKNFNPSRRSSLYAYIFYHAGVFLKEGGYLGFVTSNSYLDTDYGKDLQRWFLDNFRIIAIIDSKVERFFPSADVNTCITILQKERDRDRRNKNLVKFVYLKKKLLEVLRHFGGEDKLREFIESTKTFYEDEFVRINPVRQGELYNHQKWGIFLRAGKVYWEILKQGEWIPLEKVASVRLGILTGDNDFFYLEDITDNLKSLEDVPIRNLTSDLETLDDIKNKGLRVVKNGYNEVWLIEEDLLRDVVKTPREVDSYFVDPQRLRFKVFYFGGRKKNFKTVKEYEEFVETYYPYAWKYIKWGEQKGISEKPTYKGRKPWWDLGEWKPADILWSATYNERFFVPLNVCKVLEDKRLYGVKLKSLQEKGIFLFLNSSIGALFYFILARTNFGEGATELTVYEVQNFPIPANLNLPPQEIDKLLNLLRNSKVSSLLEEIGTNDPKKVDLKKVKPHRLELDLTILRTLGFENPRWFLKELYAELIDLVKSRLERAKSVQKTKKKRTKKEIEEYLNRLKELIKDLKPEKSYSFAKRLEEIIKTKISPDGKVARKILNAYWRGTFGEKLNLKELKQKRGNQRLLFQ